nr:hypothetical protein [Klebsiella michiganensis]
MNFCYQYQAYRTCNAPEFGEAVCQLHIKLSEAYAIQREDKR